MLLDRLDHDDLVEEAFPPLRKHKHLETSCILHVASIISLLFPYIVWPPAKLRDRSDTSAVALSGMCIM